MDLGRCQRLLETFPIDPKLITLEKEFTGSLLDALTMRRKPYDKNLESNGLYQGIGIPHFWKRIVSLITPDGSQIGSEAAAKFEAVRYFKSMLGSSTNNHYCQDPNFHYKFFLKLHHVYFLFYVLTNQF